MRRTIFRAGFTLVELLVVISIIGLLAGLLLPAVQSAREAGRRTTCINNQHNVGLAILNYENQRNTIPGWRDEIPGSGAGNASWVLLMLPLLEQNTLYDALTNNENPPIPAMASLFCPSGNNKGEARKLNYVVNAGGADDFMSHDDPVTYDRNCYNGVFLDRLKGADVKKVGIGDISSLDGTSMTLLLSENVNPGFWISTNPNSCASDRNGNHTNGVNEHTIEGALGFVFGRKYPDNNQSYMEYLKLLEEYNELKNDNNPNNDIPAPSPPPVEYLSFVRDCTLTQADGNGRVPRWLNQCKNTQFTDDWLQSSRPSANHPGVVIATFCDGGAKPIRDTIDEKTFVQLMTGCDAKSDARHFIGETILDASALE